MLPIHSSSVRFNIRRSDLFPMHSRCPSYHHLSCKYNLLHRRQPRPCQDLQGVPDYIWTNGHRFLQIWIETESASSALSSLLKQNDEEFHADLEYVKMNPTTREMSKWTRKKEMQSSFDVLFGSYNSSSVRTSPNRYVLHPDGPCTRNQQGKQTIDLDRKRQ